MRITFAISIMLTLLAGCRFKGADGAERIAPGAAGDWPFRPVAMRVHPFTSLEVGPRSSVIEARVELIDLLGDVTKGVGTLRFELYSEPPAGSNAGEGRRLYTWNAPISTLDENRQHWDSITRTYRFVLKLAQRPPAERRLRLAVQFDPTAGQRLTADAVIETGE